MSQTEIPLGDVTTDQAMPLAARMRPSDLKDFEGQRHLLGAGRPLAELAGAGIVHSMILWGPPGTGKTTLAKLLVEAAGARWISISAVLAGVKDVRRAIDDAGLHASRQTVLFVDEVHRFNKAQQDAFLPHVEKGVITLIGATTENPSFEVNGALLSRTRVYVLKPLEFDDIRNIVRRACSDVLDGIEISDDAVEFLCRYADGDARRALNTLEISLQLARDEIGIADVTEATGQSYRRFDKGGEVFYDQISALHKAVRGSSPDAALYWFARMLDGGCDPLYVARRMVRMASEDIGNADPRALSICLDAWEAFHRLGPPEGELALAQAVVYLACVPKSNAVYAAQSAARKYVNEHPSYEVPLRFRNAPTRLMDDLGYGKGYRYDHAEEDAYAAGEKYFPDEMQEEQFYFPTDRGLEQKIRERMTTLRARDEHARDKDSD
jgi:putative ATPase